MPGLDKTNIGKNAALAETCLDIHRLAKENPRHARRGFDSLLEAKPNHSADLTKLGVKNGRRARPSRHAAGNQAPSRKGNGAGARGRLSVRARWCARPGGRERGPPGAPRSRS